VADQQDDDTVVRLHLRQQIRERFLDAGFRRLLVGEVGDIRRRHGVLGLRRVDEARRHFENCAACSSSPGTPVITRRCVC